MISRWAMPRYGLVIILLALAVSNGPRSGGYERRQPAFAREFEMVWTTTRDHFYDKNMNGVDWAKVAGKYRSEASAAPHRTAFAAIINRMLAELKASHLGYYTSDDFEFYMLPAVFKGDQEGPLIDEIGVTGERMPDGFEVRAKLEGSPAAAAGLKVGDRLIEAGGQPFSTAGAFRGHAGNAMLLVAERPGTGQLTCTVKPRREHVQTAFLDAMKTSARILEVGGKKLGYLHLWCMTNDQFRQAMDDILTDKLSGTDGLILDLRDGFGGRPYGFSDVLFRPDIRSEQDSRGRRSGGHSAYAKPIVALINGGTRSAKEYFTYQLKKAGRATLVGTHTAGAFLGASGYPIGESGYLEVPVQALQLDGVRIEGRGVFPDIEVAGKNTYEPDDAQLARGEQALLDKLSSSRSQ